jgi:predicted aspartyl protease
LAAENQPQPSPIQVRALIDTGASHTCVDPSVLRPLNLTPTGSTHVSSPSMVEAAYFRWRIKIRL